MPETICNKCDKIFSLTSDVIKTECVDAEKKIERRFFQCPRCGHKYTILISDPQMPSNTSNALKALNSVNATQFNALDSISRAKAIEALKNDMASLDHIIKGMSANDVRLDAYVSQRNQVNYDIYTINNLPPVQPEQLDTNLAEVGTDCISRQAAIRLESKNTVDLRETEGSDSSQIAAQIIHDAIDNTTFAEDAYPGIKEQLHRSVEEWEKLQPVFTEIAEEYKKACEISYINKPLAYALHEVWKKHDRRDTKRNDKRRNESKKGKEPSLQKADRHTDEPGNHKRESVGDAVGVLGCPVLLRRQRGS